VFPREAERKFFSALLWEFLLALSGPFTIVAPVKDSVKDIMFSKCG